MIHHTKASWVRFNVKIPSDIAANRGRSNEKIAKEIPQHGTFSRERFHDTSTSRFWLNEKLTKILPRFAIDRMRNSRHFSRDLG